MKQALVMGGGSKNGIPILQCLLDNNFEIMNFGSSAYQHSGVTNVGLSWDSVDIEFIQRNFSGFSGTFDLVFFNHNSSSLCQDDFCLDHDDILRQWRHMQDWQHSTWISCQMPFLVLHTMRKNLSAQTKVGWMLSSYIDYKAVGVADYPDYSANKYFNYLAMKAFGRANQFQTFGLMPNFSRPQGQNILKQTLDDIVNNRVSLDIDCFKC